MMPKQTRVGSLKVSRSAFAAVYNNGQVYIIGGWIGDNRSPLSSVEICTPSDCVESETKLNDYTAFPLLFPVVDDFCQ